MRGTAQRRVKEVMTRVENTLVTFHKAAVLCCAGNPG